MTRAIIYSLSFCVVGAILEGLFAGRGIKERLVTLRSPSYSLPFWGWMVIGIAYYLICFVILARLFLLPPAPPRAAALALLGTLMFVNALWNHFFFRAGNLFHAFLLGLPYGGIAVVLFLLLLRIDPTAAVFLTPYLVYLFFASIWGYRMWKLNPPG